MKWGEPVPATDEVGPGWTMVVAGGGTGGKKSTSSDGGEYVYYYSPVLKYKFRSRAEALRFQSELDQTATPSARIAEAAAWKAINNNFERPKVWPSISSAGTLNSNDGGAEDTGHKSSEVARVSDKAESSVVLAGPSTGGPAPSRRSGRTVIPNKKDEFPCGTKHLGKSPAVTSAAFAAIADKAEKEEIAKASSNSTTEDSEAVENFTDLAAAPVGPVACGENEETFIQKLHRIIKDPELNKGSVSFTPKGLAIQINYEESFKRNVLAVHFGGMKYNFFIRKLGQYGFTPVTGSASCSWYHIKFCRDQPHLLAYLKEQTSKAEVAAAEALLLSPSKFRAGIDAIETVRSAAQSSRQSASAASIRSRAMYDPYDLMAPVRFPKKLFGIVSDTSTNNAICWVPNGRSFRLVDETKLKGVLQNRMGGMKSEELSLALTRWGFTKSPAQSIWTHPLFQCNSEYIIVFAPVENWHQHAFTTDPYDPFPFLLWCYCLSSQCLCWLLRLIYPIEQHFLFNS